MSDPWIPSTQKGVFTNALLWLFAIFAVVVVFILLSWAFGWLFAGPKGKLEARQAILSGQSRIQAYDHFFNLCAAVQGLDAALDAQTAELATATGDDRARVQANIAGITAERGRAIAQYNADAQKDYTIGQFRSLKLPFSLPTTPHKEGTQVTCAV